MSKELNEYVLARYEVSRTADGDVAALTVLAVPRKIRDSQLHVRLQTCGGVTCLDFSHEKMKQK